MLSFFENEKIAIAYVAVAMQGIDGDSNAQEYIFNALVMKKFEITNYHLGSAGKLSLLDAMATLKSMSEEKKRCVSAILGSLIIIDGRIDDKEMSLWRLLSSICSFPTMSLQDASSIMKEDL